MCDAALSDAASVCRVTASERHEDGSRVIHYRVNSMIGVLR
jgi:hypothetical protein